MSKETYTKEELAKKFNVHICTIRRFIRKFKLKPIVPKTSEQYSLKEYQNAHNAWVEDTMYAQQRPPKTITKRVK